VSAAARVRLIAAGSLLLTAFGCSFTGWGSASLLALPLLALAVAVTEIAVVHLSAGRQRFTFSLTEGAIGAAYVYAPGAWTVAAVTVGLLIAQIVRRQERLKLEFNVCQFAAGTALGAAMAHYVGGGVGYDFADDFRVGVNANYYGRTSNTVTFNHYNGLRVGAAITYGLSTK